MTKIMSPSSKQEMTDGQIEKATDAYRAMLRKHRSELGSKEAQEVLTQPIYLNDQLAVLRRHVEARSNMIVRPGIKVDRSRAPQKMLDDMGRKQYTDKKVVNAMPPGEGDVVDVYFFKPGPECYDENDLMKKEEVARQYALHGLKPDPPAVAAANEAEPAFADEKPNAVQWVGADGQLYYAIFRRWVDERLVGVRRREGVWVGRWWFGGVPASIAKPLDA